MSAPQRFWVLFLLVGTIVSLRPACGEERGEMKLVVDRVLGSEEGRQRGFWKALLGRPAAQLFARPFAVAWRGDDLLVTDPGAGRILRLRDGGRTERSEASAFTSPVGIASCDEGIFVSDSREGTVALLSESLKRVRTVASGLDRPTGLACLGGHLLVVETARHRIVELDPEGRVVQAYGSRGTAIGEFNFPTAIALRGDSGWIADTLNFRLQRLKMAPMQAEASFGQLGDAGGETPRVKGLAVDGDGRIWVTDAYLDAISIFRADGAYLATIGQRGERPGEFSLPAGIAINPRGEVAIADSFNRRVQVLHLEKEPPRAKP